MRIRAQWCMDGREDSPGMLHLQPGFAYCALVYGTSVKRAEALR